MEAHPDRWFRHEMPVLLAQAITCAEQMIGASPGEVALVVNATEGINAVIRSMALQRGDTVLCLDQGYEAIKKTLRRACACGLAAGGIVGWHLRARQQRLRSRRWQ